MAATPKTGMMRFRGLNTGRIYAVNVYISDVSGAKVTFNPQGAAGSGSDTYWVAPENVQMIDYAQVTGTADTTGITMTANGNQIPNAQALYAACLTTLNTRSPPSVKYAKGTQIGALQF